MFTFASSAWHHLYLVYWVQAFMKNKNPKCNKTIIIPKAINKYCVKASLHCKLKTTVVLVTLKCKGGLWEAPVTVTLPHTPL